MEERKSIGIFGVQQGVGVTHLCTALTPLLCGLPEKSHGIGGIKWKSRIGRTAETAAG